MVSDRRQTVAVEIGKTLTGNDVILIFGQSYICPDTEVIVSSVPLTEDSAAELVKVAPRDVVDRLREALDQIFASREELCSTTETKSDF